MIIFTHEDLPHRTFTETDKKCMIPGVLECTPDGKLTTAQVVSLQRGAETARHSWLINEHKSNYHFDEFYNEIDKYFGCDYKKAGYHEEKAEFYAYMADLRHAQYDNFIHLLEN